MLGLQDDVSTAALAISIIALIITLSQALQQFYATTEGWRGCRKDVIGDWYNLTRIRFDWRLLRFETLFVSPQITLTYPRFFCNASDATTEYGLDAMFPIGSQHLPDHRLPSTVLPSARVSWLAFLEHIRLYQLGLCHSAFGKVASESNGGERDGSVLEKGQSPSPSLEEWFGYLRKNDRTAMTMPAAVKRVISWDFMPPSVVKPFATIALHDLLVLSHRLGLDWTDVSPSDGRLTAQDDYGNTIDGTSVHGLGLMVTFQHDAGRSSLHRSSMPGTAPTNEFTLDDLLVPSAHADVLAFGVVPGDKRLGFSDVVIATDADCLNFARKIDEYMDNRRQDAREHLERSFQATDITKSGLDQLMPLISPCLSLPGCNTTRVRRPHERSHIGILEVLEGFVVFKNRIQHMKEDTGTSDHRIAEITWIQDEWRQFTDAFGPFGWVAMREHHDKAKLSTETARVHDACTTKLQNWESSFYRFLDKEYGNRRNVSRVARGKKPMVEMLRQHMFRAFTLHERATADRDLSQVERYGLDFPQAPSFCAMMHLQMDEMGDIVRDAVDQILGPEGAGIVRKDRRDLYDALVDEAGTAWLIWIFRAFVFNRSVSFFEFGTRGRPLIPSKWLYSQIPVHIS